MSEADFDAPSAASGAEPARGDALDPGTPDEYVALVRPYARTGGRTRSSTYIAIEALVATTELGAPEDPTGQAMTPEYREIATLCTRTRSVAEVSALLQIPLEVARVLLGDMAGLGLIIVYDTQLNGDRPATTLMERVLDGLQKL